MAKIELDTKQAGRDGSANNKYIRILFKLTHQGQRRYIDTNIKVLKRQFKDGQIVLHQHQETLNPALQLKTGEYNTKLGQLAGKAATMTIDDIRDYLIEAKSNQNQTDRDVFDAIDDYVATQLQCGKMNGSTPEIYQLTRRKLKAFWGVESLWFHQVDAEFLQEFHRFLIKENGNKLNSASIHERNLRAVFNKEIKEKRIPINLYPFKEFEVKSDKNTTHRNLSMQTIAAIRDCDLSNVKSNRQQINEARDLFMLSFYMNGINLIDLYNLSKSDVVDGTVEFTRQKTGGKFRYKIPPEAWEIINRYKGNDYLLVFKERIKHYENLKKSVNKFLKAKPHKDTYGKWKEGAGVGTILGIPGLTYYHARHSWATTAYELGYTIDDVGTAFGHNKKTITHTYVMQDIKDMMLRNEMNKKVLDQLRAISSSSHLKA